jgi:uncharacterized protein YbcI
VLLQTDRLGTAEGETRVDPPHRFLAHRRGTAIHAGAAIMGRTAMKDNELHPQDAADMHEPDEERDGTLREDISREMVGLYKRYSGKGPVRCRTYLEPELVTVVLGGGYTAGEQMLFEDGKWHAVRHARQLWQDTMQEKFVELIEEQTGRKVAAFMSANHQDPDLAVELFVLESEQTR